MRMEFDKLKKQLDLEEWPAVYMFKFIVENSPEKLAKVTALFDDESNIRLQPSKNGKYISVSAKEMMLSSERIIERYMQAAEIKGVIAL